MNFFHYESKFKIKKNFYFFCEGGWRGGARLCKFILHKEPKSKKKYLHGGWGWGFGGAGMVAGWVGRWMDSQTGPNQFALSTSSKLGA